MLNRYRSKISIIQAFIFGISLVIPLLPLKLNSKEQLSITVQVVICTITILVFCALIFGTYYTINDETLKIYWGFVFYKKVKITDIKHIVRNNAFFKVGDQIALTHQTLEVRFNTYDAVFIAPVKEQDFINQLVIKKPNIEIHV